MDNALKFYEKVEQFPKSSVYPYAVYKKGWCYVNQGDYKTALETFVGVVRMTTEGKVQRHARRRSEALDEGGQEGHRQGLRRTSAVPDKAWEFFQRTGGDYAPKMMEALAELYWEQGQFVDSSRVYRKVIAQNMDSPRICEWQNKIVRNTLSAGNKKDQVQEIERLGAVYDKVAEHEGRQEGPARGVPQHLPRHDEGAGAHLAQGSAEDEEQPTPTRSTSSSTRSSSTTSRRTRTPTR